MKRKTKSSGFIVIAILATASIIPLFGAGENPSDTVKAENPAVYSLYEDFSSYTATDFSMRYFTPISGDRADNPYSYAEMTYLGNQISSGTAKDIKFSGTNGATSKVEGVTGWVDDPQCDMILLQVSKAQSEAGYYWIAPETGEYDLIFKASTLDKGKGEREADGGKMRVVKASERDCEVLGTDQKTQAETAEANICVRADRVSLTQGERIYFLIDGLTYTWYDSFPVSLTVSKSVEKTRYDMYDEIATTVSDGENFGVYAASGWYVPEKTGNLVTNSVPCEFGEFTLPVWNLRLNRYQGDFGSTMASVENNAMVAWIQSSVDKMVAPYFKAKKTGAYKATFSIKTTDSITATGAEYDGARIRAGIVRNGRFIVKETYCPSTAEMQTYVTYDLTVTLGVGEEIVFAVDGNACNWHDSFYYDFQVEEKSEDSSLTILAAVPERVQENKSVAVTDLTVLENDLPVTDYTVEYSSQFPDVLSVDNHGVITGISTGEASVYVIVAKGEKCVIQQYSVTVTEGVKVSMSGSNTVPVGGSTVIACTVQNAEEGYVKVWDTLTPDILEVDQNGNVKGKRHGFGVLRVTADGGVGLFDVYVKNDYSTGTTWSMGENFPSTQDGEFTVTYAEGNAATESELTEKLNKLSFDGLAYATNWRGPTSGSWFSAIDCGIGTGTWGYGFKVPEDGDYTVDYSFYWSNTHRYSATPTEGHPLGFIVGVALKTQTGYTVCDWKYYTYEELTGITTWYVMKATTVTAKRADVLTTFFSCGDENWCDEIKLVDHKIYSSTYKKPDYTPVFDKVELETWYGDNENLEISLNAKGKEIVSIEVVETGEVLSEGSDYTISENVLTVNSSLIRKLGVGGRLIKLTTEGGNAYFNLVVYGDIELISNNVLEEYTPEETKNEGCNAAVTSVFGTGWLLAFFSVTIYLKRKKAL